MTPVSIDADIVDDQQLTGAVPAYTDIFRNVTAADGTATTGAFTEGFTGRNMVTTDRFKTIAHL